MENGGVEAGVFGGERGAILKKGDLSRWKSIRTLLQAREERREKLVCDSVASLAPNLFFIRLVPYAKI